MPKLIQKSGYIKSGGSGAGNYMNYIATRDGVEIIEDDYKQTVEVMDSHEQSGRYMNYIARRPRSHGLFSDEDSTDLNETLKEIQSHDGPVWTIIYSLKREDAARLGYDSAKSWQAVLRSKQLELAAAMKISPKNFRWCAAFHDEGGHPHVHMMIWSADPKEGYLTEQGIERMRSAVTNQIFQDELLELYQEKDMSYKEVAEQAQASMRQLVREMKRSLTSSPVLEGMVFDLSAQLGTVKGKKVYGYLKKPLKKQVDDIVDELAKGPTVAACYEQWNILRDQVESYYKDKERERLPLSQQKEFRAIKNIVIREAEQLRLGVFTFEDEHMRDAAGEDARIEDTADMAELLTEYRQVKAVLYDKESTWAEKEELIQTLERLYADGLTVAAHQLGKCYRDGVGILMDDRQAEMWFRLAADAGYDFSQYALGKLFQEQKQFTEAVEWYEKASAQGSQYADYRLGKLYLNGDGVPRDVENAVAHLAASAEAGNQYAQYTLGKLYLEGQVVKQDRKAAYEWFSRSAAQSNQYAQFFLDRWDSMGRPSVMLSVTRLLHHLSRIFRENIRPRDAATMVQRIDRKRQEQINEMKLARGQRIDDHSGHDFDLTMSGL